MESMVLMFKFPGYAPPEAEKEEETKEQLLARLGKAFTESNWGTIECQMVKVPAEEKTEKPVEEPT